MTTAIDITGWDARLTELSAGLDLTHAPARAELGSRILGAIPEGQTVATLRALARWLGSTTRARNEGVLAIEVADRWHREQEQRAAAAARKASGANPFARLPEAPSDEAF